MQIADVKADLLALSADACVLKWFAEATPHIFEPDRAAYHKFKSDIATSLGVSHFSVILVGSAATGANTRLQAFNNNSDIDIAIISTLHFEIGWKWLRELGSSRYRLPGRAQHWVREHETRLVFWGAIAADQLLPHMPFGTAWEEGLSRALSRTKFSGREISARIYRDAESLQSTLTHYVGTLKGNITGGP